MIEQAGEERTLSAANLAAETSRLALMRLLNDQPTLSQRELAEALGMSLGKTHYVLHALLNRGWVKVGNFRRNDNKMAYSYLLTPTGLREKLSLTRRFLANKEAEFEQLQALIAALRAEIEPNADLSVATQRLGDTAKLQAPIR